MAALKRRRALINKKIKPFKSKKRTKANEKDEHYGAADALVDISEEDLES